MASNNSLIGMNRNAIPAKRNKITPQTEEKPVKQFARFAYHKFTGKKRLFHDLEEYNKCYLSGEWVDSPAKVEKEYDFKWNYKGVEFVKLSNGSWVEKFDEYEDDDGEVLSKIGKGIDHTIPKRKIPQYVSQMNRIELVREGKHWGFNFDITDQSITRKFMREEIKKKNPRGLSHEYSA